MDKRILHQRMPTSEVFELDIGLGAVGVEIGVLGVHVEGLCVEIDGKIKVIVDKGFLRPRLEIRRHSRRKREHRNERRRGRNNEGSSKRRPRRRGGDKHRRKVGEEKRGKDRGGLQGSRRFFCEPTDMMESGPIAAWSSGFKKDRSGRVRGRRPG